MTPNVSFDRVPDPFVLPFLLFEWDKMPKRIKKTHKTLVQVTDGLFFKK